MIWPAYFSSPCQLDIQSACFTLHVGFVTEMNINKRTNVRVCVEKQNKKKATWVTRFSLQLLNYFRVVVKVINYTKYDKGSRCH